MICIRLKGIGFRAGQFHLVRESVAVGIGVLGTHPGRNRDVGVFQAEEAFVRRGRDLVADRLADANLDGRSEHPFLQRGGGIGDLDEVGAARLGLPLDEGASGRRPNQFKILVPAGLLGQQRKRGGENEDGYQARFHLVPPSFSRYRLPRWGRKMKVSSWGTGGCAAVQAADSLR